jgi:enamine deaminase RidA (YjgF/YER057c/UK114 family)
MSPKKEVGRFGNFMEDAYGFAQAVKSGNVIYVSGQTAFTDEGTLDGEGDMGQQMRSAYANIARALALFGATMDDVVEEKLFVTDMEAAVKVAQPVRSDVYGGKFDLASTLCEIKSLGAPQLMIEISCIAAV